MSRDVPWNTFSEVTCFQRWAKHIEKSVYFTMAATVDTVCYRLLTQLKEMKRIFDECGVNAVPPGPSMVQLNSEMAAKVPKSLRTPLS